MKAKRCKFCGGDPEFVYYAIPEEDNPYGWEWDEDGSYPMILIKQIRCKNCSALCPTYYLGCDDAVSHWNEQKLLQVIGTEPCETGVPEQEG